MKILIPGGHVTPALAVMDHLTEHEIVFVGRKYTSAAERMPSFEYQEVTARKIPFIPIVAGRFTRVVDLASALHLLRIPQGMFEAMQIMRRERPDVILSFGGYIAAPLVLAAHFLKIPVVTHEQTIAPGIANRIIGTLADTICVSFPETKSYFDASKVLVTGNPMRDSIRLVQKRIEGFKKKKPVVYVTGGSLGSHSVNEHIFAVLPELLKRYIVIHQTGNVIEFGDYEKASTLTSAGYFPFEHIDSDHIGFAFAQADVVVGRAGANTVTELLTLKKPSVLIPLPWAAEDEQRRHAELMQRLRVAEVFDQSRPSSELLQRIDMVMRNRDQYHKKFDSVPQNYDSSTAAEQVAQATLAAASHARTH